jgi:hypothetical protein
LLAGAYSFKTEKIETIKKKNRCPFISHVLKVWKYRDSFLKDKFIYVFGALTKSNYRDDIHKIKLDRKD